MKFMAHLDRNFFEYGAGGGSKVSDRAEPTARTPQSVSANTGFSMSKRKARIDSAAEAVRVMAKATTRIEPPENVPLEATDMPFFDSVIAEYARSEWSAHQLELAAMLARTMADLTREQQLLRDEGGVAYSDKGTPVANPRKSIVQMHASSILSFRRSLSLHARAQAGEARDVAKRRGAAKEIEGDNPLEDDLLARPE